MTELQRTKFYHYLRFLVSLHGYGNVHKCSLFFSPLLLLPIKGVNIQGLLPIKGVNIQGLLPIKGVNIQGYYPSRVLIFKATTHQGYKYSQAMAGATLTLGCYCWKKLFGSRGVSAA
jgi:hypothetical protein